MIGRTRGFQKTTTTAFLFLPLRKTIGRLLGPTYMSELKKFTQKDTPTTPFYIENAVY